MEANEEILKIISNETLRDVNNIDIVTPSIYKSIFAKHADSNDTDIDDEEKLTDMLLDNKISLSQNVQDKNANNIIQLSDNTNKAISAIKAKDEGSLKEVLKETQELKIEIEKLKEAIYRDELTNAYNRKWMNDNYVNEDDNTLKSDGSLAIIDLNYFKIVNDTFGHIVGDKVLLFLANQLKTTREGVIRYGGDEFIVIFTNHNHTSAFSILNKIREGIISKKLKAGKSEFRISFSIGSYEFKKGDDLSDVIEHADKIMYADKIKIKQRITGIE